MKDKEAVCFFKTNFAMLFHSKIVLVVPFNKSHLAVLVAIHKSQLAVHKKALKKPGIKKLMKLTPDLVYQPME